VLSPTIIWVLVDGPGGIGHEQGVSHLVPLPQLTYQPENNRE
jgi:hypothetical protein